MPNRDRRSLRRVAQPAHQVQQPQGKLVRVTHRMVLNVTVDMRKGSPISGQWVCEILSAENKRQLWIPAGMAHGFVVLSETAEFLYKTTEYFAPAHERCIAWDDATLAIDWQLNGLIPRLSAKDQAGAAFSSLA